MDDGAPRCLIHERVPAVARCPSCRAASCLLCWHPAAARCSTCLAKEPGGDAPEVPWEAPGPLASRFFRTLFGALRPQSTTAPLGRDRGLGRPLVFALLTFVPAVAVFGTIELTRTLTFGSTFSVEVAAGARGGAIAADVARSVGAALAVALAGLLAVGLPYTSLARAYGRSPHATTAALRVLLYRAWVVPAPAALFSLLVWTLPFSAGAEVAALGLSIPLVIGFVELVLSLRAGARDAAVIGPWISWVVVIVPVAVLALAVQFAEPTLVGLVPEAGPAQRAATSNGSPR